MIHFKIFKGDHVILRLGMFLKGHGIEKYQLETMKDGQIKVWFDTPTWLDADKFLPPQDANKLKKHSIDVPFQYITDGQTIRTNGYYDYDTKTWYTTNLDEFGATYMNPLKKDEKVIKWGA